MSMKTRQINCQFCALFALLFRPFRSMNGHAKQRSFSTMQILFNKTIEQCRQLGARGGRAYGRNLRLRQSQAPVPPVAQLPAPPVETVHQASLRLDA
jgi:hypothetical protein